MKTSSENRHIRFFEFLVYLFILIGSMLISIQLRTQILPIGKTLGPDYEKITAPMIGIPLVAAFIAAAVPQILNKLKIFEPIKSLYPRLVLASIALVMVFIYFYPDTSLLQMVYFFTTSVTLGGLMIILPRRIRRGVPITDWINDLQELWRYRHLYRLWLKFTIQARYTQTILGIIWIVLLPLATSAVLALAFSQFLKIGRFQGDTPFIVFFMAGLVPFGLFNGGITKSTSSIAGNIDLISRVYFPREILVLLGLGEAIIDFLFTLLVLFLINGFAENWPTATIFLMPIPFFILVGLTLGLMFIISTWSLLIRDIPQLVGVLLQLMLYVTPILYPYSSIPENLRFIILLNPLTPVVQAFRDILITGIQPDYISLFYPFVLSITLIVLGHAIFKANEGIMSDLV